MRFLFLLFLCTTALAAPKLDGASVSSIQPYVDIKVDSTVYRVWSFRTHGACPQFHILEEIRGNIHVINYTKIPSCVGIATIKYQNNALHLLVPTINGIDDFSYTQGKWSH